MSDEHSFVRFPERQNWCDSMNFRRGIPTDAENIARLISSFQSELTDDPFGAGAESYLASVSTDAERQYIESNRYMYIVAENGSSLTGFIAIRDKTHLFHLFVEKNYQRQGLARSLWKLALSSEYSISSSCTFTVNASLSAVPVYKAFGFEAAGEVKHVHGISFLPMQLNNTLYDV